ncbi:MAG: transposase [Actinomycetota bacterium]
MLGVEEGDPLRVPVECRLEGAECPGCGSAAWVKDRAVVELVDLPAFGRPARLRWRKHRLCCPNPDCSVGSWTVREPRIASPRLQMTDRAGRWATWQVGRHGRTVSEVAVDLGCDWHTVNDAVLAYGEALVDHPGRIGQVEALGLDETLFCRRGEWRHQSWATSIVDVASPQLLDVVEGREARAPAAWLAGKGKEWCSDIRFGVLDLSGAYRACFDIMLPDAIQVADPFHVVRVANESVDDCRRRVQNEILGHRGRKHDPLYRVRRLLTRA